MIQMDQEGGKKMNLSDRRKKIQIKVAFTDFARLLYFLDSISCFFHITANDHAHRKTAAELP